MTLKCMHECKTSKPIIDNLKKKKCEYYFVDPYIPLLLFRMEPRVPNRAKANKGLTSSVSKTGGIIFRKRFK